MIEGKSKKKAIKKGLICFFIFTTPWLLLTLVALIRDPGGFSVESTIGIVIGILIFAFVGTFFGFSLLSKSIILRILAYLCIIAIPVLWWMNPWLP